MKKAGSHADYVRKAMRSAIFFLQLELSEQQDEINEMALDIVRHSDAILRHLAMFTAIATRMRLLGMEVNEAAGSNTKDGEADVQQP